MKLKWSNTKIEGISMPVKKAEKDNSWSWWGLYVVFILMAIAFLIKLRG